MRLRAPLRAWPTRTTPHKSGLPESARASRGRPSASAPRPPTPLCSESGRAAGLAVAAAGPRAEWASVRVRVGRPAEPLVEGPETPVWWTGTSRGPGRSRCESWVPMPGPTRTQASPLKRLRAAPQLRAEQRVAQRPAMTRQAELLTAVLAQPAGPWPGGLARPAEWSASLRPRCAGCLRSTRALPSVALYWRLALEPRPRASAVPLALEPRQAALAWLSTQDRTNRSSSESSSASAGPRRGSRMETRRASCARSAVQAARCRFLREPSPTHDRRRLAWRPAHPQPNPLRARPPAMTAARASGPPAPARRAAPREARRDPSGRSGPMKGSASASALPALDRSRRPTRLGGPSATSRARFPSSEAPGDDLPPRLRQ
jgi:hypothetical protein